MKPFQILDVEDNPGDARLIKETLGNSNADKHIQVVQDGVEALAFLHRDGAYSDVPRPDLILLDLNLPKTDGRQVLAAIKTDKDLKTIPVVVLTTSQADEDILKAYGLNANCYVTKPVDLDDFMSAVKSIEEFWSTIVKLPPELA